MTDPMTRAATLYPADPFSGKPAPAPEAAPTGPVEKPAAEPAKAPATVGEIRAADAVAKPAEPQAETKSPAERMYPDDSFADQRELGINAEGMRPESPDQVSLEMPPDWRPEDHAEAVAGAQAAFHAADLPQEMVSSLTADFRRHSVEPVTLTVAQSLAELRKVWGAETEAKIALAQQLIARASTAWPGLKDYLEAHGTGNDPKVIRKIVARAEVLKRSGKL